MATLQTPVSLLRDMCTIVHAKHLAERLGVELVDVYTELVAAEARGIVRCVPIDGNLHVYGWEAM